MALPSQEPRVQTPLRASALKSQWAWLPAALASILCLSPLVLLWKHFQPLYWFHDDWDLISHMQEMSFFAWLGKPIGENFSPLFNALWNGAVLEVRGNYMGMIAVLWITHIAILLLFAALLRRSGLSWKAQTLAVVTLGMPWSHIETLAWAASWSSLLCALFFLAAWVLLLSPDTEWSRKWAPLLAVLCAVASAWTFSRGVISGVVLAFFLVASVAVTRRRAAANSRDLWTAGYLAAATLACLVPYRWMPREYHGFQDLDGARIAAMLSYGAHYILLSPLFHLLPIPHKIETGLRELFIAGALKVLIIAAGFYVAKDREKPLLWTFLLLDLGTAALLGLGRYDRELATAVSYRYQYVSLLCFAPFFAIVVVRAPELLNSSTARNIVFAVILIGWALLLGFPWRRHIDRWAQWRGTDVRNALAAASDDERFGLPSITAGRARELIKIYQLH